MSSKITQTVSFNFFRFKKLRTSSFTLQTNNLKQLEDEQIKLKITLIYCFDGNVKVVSIQVNNNTFFSLFLTDKTTVSALFPGD